MATDFRIPIVADGGDFEAELRKQVMSAMGGVVADVRRSMGDVNKNLKQVDASGFNDVASAAEAVAKAVNKVSPTGLKQTADAAKSVAQEANKAAAEASKIGSNTDVRGLQAAATAAGQVADAARKAAVETASIGDHVTTTGLLDVVKIAKQIEDAANKAAQERTVRFDAVFDGSKAEGDAKASFGKMQGDARSAGNTAGDAFSAAFAGGVGGIAANLADEVNSGGQRAASEGTSGGKRTASNFVSSIADGVSSLGSKAGPLAGAALGVVAIFAGTGALIAKTIQDGLSQELSRDMFQAQTKTTEAQARKFAQAAAESYADAFGESVEANLSTAKIALHFGFLDESATQRDAEHVINILQGVSDVVGTTADDTARAIGALINSGLVDNFDNAADLITAASQAGLDRQGDLIDSISEYSAGWKNTGLSAETTMALIAQSMDLGVDNTDRAADALREFGRRVTEEGDTIISSLNGIGLNGQEMYDAFKRGGTDAEVAFDKTFDAIRAIEDPVKRNQVAMDLLGDTAGDFIGAFTQWDPSAAVEKFGSVQGAAQRAVDVMGGNAATTIEGAMRSMSLAADSLKAAFAEAFGPQISQWANQVSNNREGVMRFFQDIGTTVFDAGIAVLEFTEGGMRGLASFTQGAANVSASILDMGANILSVAEAIPGFAQAFQIAGGTSSGELRGMADSARQMGTDVSAALVAGADGIHNTLIPGLEAGRAKFVQFSDSMIISAAFNDAIAQVNGAVTNLGVGLDGSLIQIHNWRGSLDTTIPAQAELANQLSRMPGLLMEQTKAGIDSKATVQELTTQYWANREALIGQMQQIGLTREQADQLIRSYGLVPELINTQINQPGMPKALTDLDLLNGLVRRDNEKNVIVLNNSAETAEALKRLNLTVMDNKVIPIDANDQRAQQVLRDFLNQPAEKFIPLTPIAPQPKQAPPSYLGPTRAFGGIDLERFAGGGARLPRTALIKPPTGNLVQWAEPGTGGEAFIPLAPDRRAGSMKILEQVAAMFGYQLVKMAAGGIQGGAAAAAGGGGNLIGALDRAFQGFGADLVASLASGIQNTLPMLASDLQTVLQGAAVTAAAGGEAAGGAAGINAIAAATTAAQTALTTAALAVTEQFNPAIAGAQLTAQMFGQSVVDAATLQVVPATQMIQQAAFATGTALLDFANMQANPALAGVQAAAQLTGQVMLDVANLQAIPALNSVGTTTTNLATLVGTTVNELLNPTITSVGTTTQTLATNTGIAVNEQILPTWSNMATSLEATRAGQIDPTLQALQSAVGTTADSFRTGVDMATQHWDRLKEATAVPVRWTIDQVFNRGVAASWNAVSEMLGTKPMAPIPINFAKGGQVGRVRGPGGGIEDRVPGAVPRGSFILRSAAARLIDPDILARMNAVGQGMRQRVQDLVPVNLSNREMWLAPGVVRRLGLKNLEKFNREARDPQGLFPALNDVRRRMSAGGLVRGTPAWEALKRGHDWARSRHGRPYVLGGSSDGGGGTDCSGYMSGIADVIHGGNGHRQWATMAFNGGGNSQQPSGPQGFVAGLAAGFSIGVLNGGPAGGHTAGTLGGVEGLPTVNVESGGSHGNVAYGGPAVGADHSQFPTKYHLDVIDGMFRSAGGGGGSSAVDYVALVRAKIDPIWEAVTQAINGRPFPGGIGGIPPSARAKMQQITTDKLVALAAAMTPVGAGPGGGVEQWRPVVQDLLRRYKFPMEWEHNTMRRMAQENASGDPGAVNDYDVNWQNGIPSVGLMQVTRPAYMDHKDPALDKGPYKYGVSIDPAANIGASMRYGMSRYGSLPAAYDRAGGYFRGGQVFDQGGLAAGMGFLQKHAIAPERVLSPRQTAAFESLVQIIGKFSSARSFSDLERIFKEQVGSIETAIRDLLPDSVAQGVAEAVKPQTDAAKTIASAVAGAKPSGVSVFDEVEGKLLRSHPDLFSAGRSTSSREEVAAAEEAERQKRIEEMRKAAEESWEKFKTEILPRIEQGWQQILSSPEVQQFQQQAEAFGAQAAGAFQGFMRQHGVPGFDLGGVANGVGLMPKNTIRPERVLSPQQTRTFDQVVPLLERLQRWQVSLRSQLANAYRERMMEASHRRTIYAPFTVNGMPERVAREAQNRLLSLLDA